MIDSPLLHNIVGISIVYPQTVHIVFIFLPADNFAIDIEFFCEVLFPNFGYFFKFLMLILAVSQDNLHLNILIGGRVEAPMQASIKLGSIEG